MPQDLSTSPSLFEKSQAGGKKWIDFLIFIHQVMATLGLRPVRTPALVKATGLEPEIQPFHTRLKTPDGGWEQRLLPTSPEISMKQLLCRGFKNIYELKQCFRNGEQGPFNHTEFYLLEWYRTERDLNTLVQDLKTLLSVLSQKMKAAPVPPFQKTTMQALFKKHLGVKLTPRSGQKDFIKWLEKRHLPFKPPARLNDLFHLLFLNGIEPGLDPHVPLIIYNYPPFQKAYSRLSKEGWALRFEFFWKGLELANAFDEVTQALEQRHRFEEENKERRHQGLPLLPLPEALLQDMKHRGMPPCVGIALGVERLFMALTGLKNIHTLMDGPSREWE